MAMLACCFIISLTSLSTDGFVNKLLKRCALMQTEVAAKLRTKSLTEPCLLLGISRNFLSCISCEVTELPTVSIHRESALSETAKFLTFTVHETLRNVMFTESLAEFSPSSDMARWAHSSIILPP